MLSPPGMTVQHHQARPIPLRGRRLGNAIGRQVKIKIRYTHTGRKRETTENVDPNMA